MLLKLIQVKAAGSVMLHSHALINLVLALILGVLLQP